MVPTTRAYLTPSAFLITFLYISQALAGALSGPRHNGLDRKVPGYTFCFRARCELRETAVLLGIFVRHSSWPLMYSDI